MVAPEGRIFHKAFASRIKALPIEDEPDAGAEDDAQTRIDEGRRQHHDDLSVLGSLIKSARDIMRKDKGLNGDLIGCRC